MTKLTHGFTRRDFLRRSALLGWTATVAAFAAASIGFLWPRLGQGFGSRQLVVGPVDSVRESVAEEGHLAFLPGRLHVVAYDPALDRDSQYEDITSDGLMALYHKCPHLGCRVPWCGSSNWFECPCHGSRYNRWGEYQFGPAPRGMDRFALRVEDGQVVVDTATIVTGPARTGGVLQQPPQGSHCI